MKDFINRNQKMLKYLGLGLFCLLVVACCIVFLPHIEAYQKDGMEESLKNAKKWVDQFGIFKYVVILVIQLLQVFVAFIPGEPVEIFSGYMCGTVGGLLVCELGATIGTIVIYKLVEKLGKKATDRVIGSKAYEKLKFLHNSGSRDSFLFLLFFIPGTPKDVLTYLAPLLRVGVWRLTAITAIARIPSVVSSTYVGANLSKGNLTFSLLVFAGTAVAGALGIVINDLILDRKTKKRKDKA